MKTTISLMIAFIFSYGNTTAQAQNLLYNPEHVVYDSLHQRYLVSNYGDGKIIAIDLMGNQTLAIDGITGSLGLHIVDTVLCISAGHNVHLYSLNSFTLIQTLTLSVSNWLDGMIDDGMGNLYAVENAGKIHKISLTALTDTIIISGGLPLYPQDVAYDPDSNRLIVVCWQTNSPVAAVNLNNYSVSTLMATSLGQFDGIIRDDNGDLYLSSWRNGGRIYKLYYPYTAGPVSFSQGHAGPAGLGLNWNNRTLVVPNFNANSLSYLPLNTASVDVKHVKGNKFQLHQNYPNPFNPSTTIGFEISEPGFVSLKIYNLLGQEVADLIHRKMNAGNHFITWNADRFAGGIFFYRMTVNDQSITRKMILTH